MLDDSRNSVDLKPFCYVSCGCFAHGLHYRCGQHFLLLLTAVLYKTDIGSRHPQQKHCSSCGSVVGFFTVLKSESRGMVFYRVTLRALFCFLKVYV